MLSGFVFTSYCKTMKFPAMISSSAPLRLCLTAMATLCLSTLSLAQEQAQSEGFKRANILLIVVPDLGHGQLAYQGNGFNETPNIDALAKDGMRFPRAYAAAPLPGPSMASLLTGMYPGQDADKNSLLQGDVAAGPLSNDGLRLNPRSLTLAEILAAEGYSTAFVGHWPLGGPRAAPADHGFEHVAGNGWLDYAEAVLAPSVADRFLRGSSASSLGARAAEFIYQSDTEPFFMTLSYYGVAPPLVASAEKLAHFESKLAALEGADADGINPRYAARLADVDSSIGAVLEALEQKGKREETLVVFTSSNGGLTGRESDAFGRAYAHTPATDMSPLRGGKGMVYEGGLRVPLVLSWPNALPQGAANTVMTVGYDIFSTLTVAAGYREYKRYDGENLFNVLAGLPLNRELYWHVPYSSEQGGEAAGVIVSDGYKLIERLDTGALELYQLGEDPGEENDLAAVLPVWASKLQARLQAWRQAQAE